MIKKEIRQKILDEYFENKISMNKISQKYGVNRNTIKIWMDRLGLKNKYHKKDKLDKQEIIRMYTQDRCSSEEIAKKFNVSVTPIRKILKDANVQRKQYETLMGKFIGEKNPNWKGGVKQQSYTKWRSRIQYFATKLRIFKNQVKIRDCFTCKMCGSQEKLEVNHILPVRDISEEFEFFDPNNGITLCKECHKSIFFKEHQHIDYFKTLIKLGSE